MKALKLVEISPIPWFAKVTCGPIKDGPAVKGCKSEFEISLGDLFFRETRIPNGTFQSFHWKCPNCNAINSVDYRTLPNTSTVLSQKKFLENKRNETIIAIAKLHDAASRTELVEEIGDDLLLSDDIIQKIIDSPELYS